MPAPTSTRPGALATSVMACRAASDGTAHEKLSFSGRKTSAASSFAFFDFLSFSYY